MTTPEALSSLRAYQAWRRGDDERSMPDAGITPAQVGKTIDHAITVLAKLDYWHSATDAQMRQLMGELSAQDIRNIRAVLSAIHHVS